MLRIGISQRVESHIDLNEVHDALDQAWAPLLWSLGLLAIPLNSRMPDNEYYLKTLGLDGFILSGGNDIGTALERDALETAILVEARSKKLPVMGVCRGMQFINVFCNGKLERIKGHAATSHSIMGQLPDLYNLRTVNSFHNFGINESGLGVDLCPIAYSGDKMIEAVRHNKVPWLGIMWHPERITLNQSAHKNIIANHFGIKA